jgi:transcriptional regulator with XRE-family HTH domain
VDDAKFVTDLGSLIREARHAKKLTLRQLAAQLGVSHQCAWKWEQGLTKEPPLPKLLRLAAALEIPLDRLAGVNTPPTAEDKYKRLIAKLRDIVKESENV